MTIQSSVNQMLSVASILKKAFSKSDAAAPTAPTGTTSKAESSLAKKQDQVRQQRRKFTDYMRDEPVMGRKFKDLDPTLQKKILSHYTTKQRKEIMDRKDAEKEASRR